MHNGKKLLEFSYSIHPLETVLIFSALLICFIVYLCVFKKKKSLSLLTTQSQVHSWAADWILRQSVFWLAHRLPVYTVYRQTAELHLGIKSDFLFLCLHILTDCKFQKIISPWRVSLPRWEKFSVFLLTEWQFYPIIPRLHPQGEPMLTAMLLKKCLPQGQSWNK